MQNEFMLINVVTVREGLRTKLEKVVTSIKTLSRPMDEACMIEVFNLIHSVREATCDLMNAVCIWQQGFTQNIRPQMLNIDYLVDMRNSLEFFSTCNVRKEWRFQLGAGNFMLLPMPTVGRTQKPRAVSKELRAAVTQFANYTEHRLVTCYTQLLNCLPKEDFKKMLSIQHWMKNRWVPNIEKEPRAPKMDPWSRMMRGEITDSEYKSLVFMAKAASANAASALQPSSGFAEGRRGAMTPAADDVGAAADALLAVDATLAFESQKAAAERRGEGDIPLGARSRIGDPFALIPPPSQTSSPLRPPRQTRLELFQQYSQGHPKKGAKRDDAFSAVNSDDSEDERLRNARKEKKSLYKRAETPVVDPYESPKRGLREKKLEAAQTIEEKAARSAVNTRMLRETWNAPAAGPK